MKHRSKYYLWKIYLKKHPNLSESSGKLIPSDLHVTILEINCETQASLAKVLSEFSWKLSQEDTWSLGSFSGSGFFTFLLEHFSALFLVLIVFDIVFCTSEPFNAEFVSFQLTVCFSYSTPPPPLPSKKRKQNRLPSQKITIFLCTNDIHFKPQYSQLIRELINARFRCEKRFFSISLSINVFHWLNIVHQWNYEKTNYNPWVCELYIWSSDRINPIFFIKWLI